MSREINKGKEIMKYFLIFAVVYFGGLTAYSAYCGAWLIFGICFINLVSFITLSKLKEC